MKFEEKLIQLRKRKGLSQEELADKLGVSRQAISRWETGTVLPDADNLLRISELFDVSIDCLLHDEYECNSDFSKIQRKPNDKTENQSRSHLIACILWSFAAICFACSAVLSSQFNPLLYVNIILDLILALREYKIYRKHKESQDS